jgi:pimeloyl-ACP methyl ester carboxylesterase
MNIPRSSSVGKVPVPDLLTSDFIAPDGIKLAVHEMGEGRAVLLLHGYFSDAATNWIKYGHAARLAGAGFRVIMPDLRAHGASDKPHDGAHYPKDVLADDALALVAALGLTDYDLGGYSLGGRTVARMLARGATPARAVIAGMGLAGLTHTGGRTAHFRQVFAGLGTHPRGSPAWMAEAFLKTTGGDPVALARILDTFVDTSEAVIRSWATPVQVLVGEDDDDNGSGAALAAILRDATLSIVAGNHMSAVTKVDLGEAMLAFLERDDFSVDTDRHCEERSDAAIQTPERGTGLPRFARNDDLS